MRHFRDTLEWTSGDRHSIHAVEESIEHILYYTRTDAEEQLVAPVVGASGAEAVSEDRA